MTTSWHSYTSLLSVGHKAAVQLFDGPVLIEEKVDGSQFSFGIFEGEIKVRSKGAQLIADAPEKMFVRAVDSVRERAHLLVDGWTYRGEYLQKPKHNALAYDRHPEGHIIIFDIAKGEEDYLPYDEKAAETVRIGLEVVPKIYEGEVTSAEFLTGLLDRESILGGQKVEGVVVKNYAKFGQDGKVLIGKYVSAAFKEIHGKEWREANPLAGDIVRQIIQALRTPARWQKAVQHLREADQLEVSPRDIGKLIGEIGKDVHRECQDEIKDALFKWAWPQIQRGVVAGAPEWYKDQLAEMQFAQEPEEDKVTV